MIWDWSVFIMWGGLEGICIVALENLKALHSGRNGTARLINIRLNENLGSLFRDKSCLIYVVEGTRTPGFYSQS